MSNSNNALSGGIGLEMLLFIIFLILKLTGAITWSWWWVTCPLWIGVALVSVVLILAAIGISIFGRK